MAKVKKSVDTFTGAKKKWEAFTSQNEPLTGVQKQEADAIVDAIASSENVVFWTGQATGKSYLFEQLSKCFGG